MRPKKNIAHPFPRPNKPISSDRGSSMGSFTSEPTILCFLGRFEASYLARPCWRIENAKRNLRVPLIRFWFWALGSLGRGSNALKSSQLAGKTMENAKKNKCMPLSRFLFWGACATVSVHFWVWSPMEACRGKVGLEPPGRRKEMRLCGQPGGKSWLCGWVRGCARACASLCACACPCACVRACVCVWA